ncbi:DUF3600 domain-containing protein [Paenibacillus polymyxa]|uniref:DUF3600 domain-containing protein n=1 Tax=Paenibacillus polymyxa TaxID=1406 RepID=UPI0008FCB247|nr:DUF3600 domain-containing protein [Paenibacillus polymyxa]APB72913.1 DUF3600 domain-containing protein [Paenibacillus polymyxa]
MKLEQELRRVMQQDADHILGSAELKENIMSQIERIEKGGSKPMKKYIVITLLAAVLLIPTGAFAAYTYLADTMYGSQEKLIEMGGSPEEYNRLESKLQQAQGHLTKDEFTVFMGLLRELGAYNLKMTDENGALHKERLSAEEQREYDHISAKLDPYFDKLNQGKVLTQTGDGKKDGGDSAITGTLVSKAYAGIDLQVELDYAKKVLTEDEFVKFRVLFTEFYKYIPRITGENGVLYPDRLTEREREDYEEHLKLLQPYFDQFNSLE